MDKLEKMFQIQNNFQKSCFDRIKDPKDLQQFVNQMLLACHEEVTEVMKETAYKHPDAMPFGWKETQTWNVDNYKEEIIDLWHFVMNLWLCVGGTPEEFFDKYLEKNAENIERWKNGY